MDLPDVHSILFQPADVMWQGETPPSPKYIRLMNSVPLLFDQESIDLERIRETLEKIAKLTLQPSQAMRLSYWDGHYHRKLFDHTRAFANFDQALNIAVDGDDLDSMVALVFAAANALFNDVQFAKALHYDELALDYWHTMRPNPDTRNPVTEMILQTVVAREKWSIGNIEESHQLLAHVLGIARHSRRVRNKAQFTRQYANALWMLGLVFRTQSDEVDGDFGHLHDALSRMQSAVSLYARINPGPSSLGRLAIQIAEVYLDLVELHLQRLPAEGARARAAARAMRVQALDHIERANRHLASANDDAGQMLARIARLRWRMTWPSAYTSAREFGAIQAEFDALEHDPVIWSDVLLQAKEATLRAEWLIAIHDWEPARAALSLALEGFAAGGAGMATRALRLQRRLDASRDPEGFADPETNSKN